MRTGVFVLPFCMCLLKNIEVFISVSLIWEMQKKKRLRCRKRYGLRWVHWDVLGKEAS